jgi:hypothetical protein
MVYDAMGVTFLLLRPASSGASHCGLISRIASRFIHPHIHPSCAWAAIVTFQTRVDNHTGWGKRTTLSTGRCRSARGHCLHTEDLRQDLIGFVIIRYKSWFYTWWNPTHVITGYASVTRRRLDILRASRRVVTREMSPNIDGYPREGSFSTFTTPSRTVRFTD